MCATISGHSTKARRTDDVDPFLPFKNRADERARSERERISAEGQKRTFFRRNTQAIQIMTPNLEYTPLTGAQLVNGVCALK